MNKNIEERAKINATKAIEYACGRRVGEPDYITNLFIQIATEQKAIDIDKACDAFCNTLCPKGCILESGICPFEDRFRKTLKKALEE